MKSLALAGALALAVSLAGCAGLSSVVTSTNKTLAQLAQNDWPAACGIVTVAEGYFIEEKSHISAANVAKGVKAAAFADSLCNGPPPTNVASALASLANAWLAVQNATRATS